MSDWLSALRHDWAAMSAAPVSLTVAIVLSVAVTWAAAHWFYSAALGGRHAEIVQLDARLSAYRDALGGADPEQARSLRDELAAAKQQLAALQSPEREPNAVYQNGRQIGVVDGVEIDAANTSVGFQRMTLDHPLDQATNLEFRDLVIGLRGYAAVSRIAQSAGAIYHSPRFAVVGHRREGCP
jgi:hypothetical protein